MRAAGAVVSWSPPAAERREVSWRRSAWIGTGDVGQALGRLVFDRVRGILTEFGWEAEDVGGVEGARAIEPLGIPWCLPGFLRDEWSHAFKLLR